jgi:hypothetical protein
MSCSAPVTPRRRSGKTVLFKPLIGALPFHGVTRWAPNTRIGYVPQKLDIGRDLSLTGNEFLRVKADVLRMPAGEIAHALVLVGLSEIAATRPNWNASDVPWGSRTRLQLIPPCEKDRCRVGARPASTVPSLPSLSSRPLKSVRLIGTIAHSNPIHGNQLPVGPTPTFE